MTGHFVRDCLEHEVLVAERKLQDLTTITQHTRESLLELIRRANVAMKSCAEKQFKICMLSNFEICGQGTFGLVWRCNHNEKKVVLKQDKAWTRSTVEASFRERDILMKLNHPNTIQLLGSLYDGNVFLLFEKCEGDTAVYLNWIQTSHLHSMVSGLLSAVVYIHSLGVLHRDIKPGNILLTKTNSIKLADFGSAVQLPQGTENHKSERNVGTFCYMPKEVLEAGQYSKKSDMFSVAATIFEWETKQPLLRSRVKIEGDAKNFYINAHRFGRIKEKKEKNKFVHIWDGKKGFQRQTITDRLITSRFNLFLQILCNPDVSLRPNSDQVLSLDRLKTCLRGIQASAVLGATDLIVSDEGRRQKQFMKDSADIQFCKSTHNADKMQEMIGFYYENSVYFSKPNPTNLCRLGTVALETADKSTQHGINSKNIQTQTSCLRVKELEDPKQQDSIVKVSRVPLVHSSWSGSLYSEACLDTAISSPFHVEKNVTSQNAEFLKNSTKSFMEIPAKDLSKSRLDGLELGTKKNIDEIENEGGNRNCISPNYVIGDNDKEAVKARKARRYRDDDHKLAACDPVFFEREGYYKRKPERKTRRNIKRKRTAAPFSDKPSCSDVDEYKYKCSNCGKKFKTPGYKNRCERNHLIRYSCGKCGNSFLKMCELASHLLTKHKTSNPRKCHFCGEDFQSEPAFNQHKQLCKVNPNEGCSKNVQKNNRNWN